MESYRSNKFLFVTSVISLMILAIGTTFSFFSVSQRSTYDAVVVQANKISLSLKLTPKYTGYSLIPTNDVDIMTAYEQECLDKYDRGACLAYEIEVSNYSTGQDIIGKINFDVTGINNLSYIVLDEKDEVYLGKTPIKNGVTERMSLGSNFILTNGTELLPTTKKFTILIWLTNLDRDQTEEDAGGTFTASVSYESVYGSKMTGYIKGTGEENGEVSEVGETE